MSSQNLGIPKICLLDIQSYAYSFGLAVIVFPLKNPVFYVGLVKIHSGATPLSVMVLFVDWR